MLKKLFKYDMRSISRLLLPLSLIVIITTIAGTAALRVMINLDSTAPVFVIVKISLTLFLIATILALLVYTVFSEIMIFARFYTNLFTDEGYLTFTLPVKASSILNAKILSAFLNMLLTIVTLLLCIFIYVAFGTADNGLINTAMLSELGEFISKAFTEAPGFVTKSLVEFIVLMLVSVFYATLSVYLALTIGATIAKKHKIIAGIGIYYGINTAMGMFTGIINAIFTFTNIDSPTISVVHYMDISFAINIVAFLLFGVAAYFITKHLLKNKLNLA